MQYDITTINGLATKPNRINQSEFNCIDCDNVHKNDNGTLVKLDAFSQVLAQVTNIIDGYHLRETDEYFIVESDRFSKITNASRSIAAYELISLFTANVFYSGSNLSFQEMNGNLYIADPRGKSFVQKYDGQIVSRAGVGVPTVSTDTGAEFYRAFFTLKDKTGLATSGDYVQAGTDTNYQFAVSSVDMVYKTDRDIKGLTLSSGSFAATYNDPLNTPNVVNGFFTVTASEHNLVVGDDIYTKWTSVAQSVGSVEEIKIRVISITPNGLDFDIEFGIVDYDGNEDNIYGAVFYGAISSLSVSFAISSNETYGYQIAEPQDGDLIQQAANYMYYRDDKSDEIVYALVAISFNQDLEDFYDGTTIKGDMPKMKYISAFNNQLIGVTGKYTIAWSDLGLASSCETFAPFDTDTFNKSDEGIITGIFGGDSFVSVFKESEIYHLQGILYDRAYRTVKDSSSGIGCESHASIVRFAGGCVFLSAKGFYFSTGQLAKDLTGDLEDLIKGIENKSTVRAVADYVEERIYFLYDAGSFEFDYSHNNWWKHSLYDSSQKMFFNLYEKDKSMIIDSTGLYEEDSSLVKSHAGFYRTSWMCLGTPFFEKRFNYFIAISAYGAEFEVKTESFWNWGTESDESFTKTFSATNFINEYGIQKKKAHSFSFSMISEAGQDLSIDGFAIDYEEYQTKVRS